MIAALALVLLSSPDALGQLADKVEALTKDQRTQQDRALSVAEWVAGNIHNEEWASQTPAQKPTGDLVLDTFLTRSGLCAARAHLFVAMLRIAGIEAKHFLVYDFGIAGNDHSAVLVNADGKWRYFDVTYAGVFMDDGAVMTWEEIIANPEKARRGMVVFPRTIDRDREGRPVNNHTRMREFYTLAAFRAVKKYGTACEIAARSRGCDGRGSRIDGAADPGPNPFCRQGPSRCDLED